MVTPASARMWPVDLGFDLRELFIGNRAGVMEIEAQSVRRHQRSRLAHMGAKLAAQHRMQNMGRRMIEHGFLPMLRIHRQPHFIANLNAPLFDARRGAR